MPNDCYGCGHCSLCREYGTSHSTNPQGCTCDYSHDNGNSGCPVNRS